MSVDLAGLYGQVLDLTFRQRLAIRQGRWADLLALLDDREDILARAGMLLSAELPDRQSLHDVLVRIRETDETNQRILGARRQDLLAEIHGRQHARSALSGYQSALRGSGPAASVFDRAR